MPHQPRRSAVRPSFWYQGLSWLCIVTGLVAFVWFDLRGDFFVVPPQDAFIQSSRPTIPQRITIPSAQIDQTLEPAALSEQGWSIAANKSNYLLDSARPGENSNVVIYGHNLLSILGKLKLAEVGDTVRIETADKEIWYEITSKQVVWPTEVRVIQPTDSETLTVFTCTGLLDSQRLVIQAKPIRSYYRTKTACIL